MGLHALSRHLRVAGATAILGLLALGPGSSEATQPKVELVPQLGHPANVRNVVFSGNGRLAASIDRRGTLKVWDLEQGFEMRAAFTNSEMAEVLGFSADSGKIYVAGDHGLVTLDAATGQLVLAGEIRPELLLADRRTYLQSRRRAGIVVGDLESRAERAIAGVPEKALIEKAAAAGRTAAVHLRNTREILVLDVDARAVRRRIPIDSDRVEALTMSADGSHVALIGRDASGPRKAAAYRVDTGARTVAYDAPDDAHLYAAAFLPGTLRLAIGGSQGLGGVRVVDVAQGTELSALPWPRRPVDFIGTDAAEGRIAIVSNASIEVRPAASGATERQLGASVERAVLVRSATGAYYAVRDDERGGLTVYASAGHAQVLETTVAKRSEVAFVGDRAILFHRDDALWVRRLPQGPERKLVDKLTRRIDNLAAADQGGVLAYSLALTTDVRVVRLGADDSVLGDQKTMEIEGMGLVDRGLALSPDGSLMATRTLTDNALTLRETATGAVVSQLGQSATSTFHNLRFSRDGRSLLYRDGERLRVWRGAPWSQVFDRTSARRMDDVDFAPDGMSVWAVGSDGVFGLSLTSPYAETSVSSLRGRSLVSISGASPGGVVIDRQGGRTAFQFSSPGRTIELKGNIASVQRVVAGDDGNFVATSELDRRLTRTVARIWDVRRGSVACHLDEASVIGTHSNGWIAIAAGEVRLMTRADCSTESRLAVPGSFTEAAQTQRGEILALSFDGTFALLDMKRGIRVAAHRVPSGDFRPALVHQMGAVAYFDRAREAVLVVGTDGSSELGRLELKGELPAMMQGVPGTSLLVVASSGRGPGRIRVWDVEQKRVIREAPTGSLDVSAATVDVARGMLLVGLEQGGLAWLRLDAEKAEHGVLAHQGAVTSIRSLPDGRIFTSGDDGTVRLWRGRPAAPDASLVNFANGDWVATTPEGYFNASPGGAEGIVFRRELSVLPLNQFYDVFYRPDIVQSRLRGENAKALMRLTIDDALAHPPPQAEIVSSSGGGERTIISYRVRSTGGGVGDIRIFHNGKLLQSDELRPVRIRERIQTLASVTPESVARALLVGESAENPTAPTQGPPKPDVVEGRIEVENVPGENEIAIAAYNRPNTVQGNLKRIAYSSAMVVDPRIYILSIGIDDYSERPLKFAVKDARDFAGELQRASGSLHKPGQIEVIELHNAAATRQGILDALAKLEARVRPWDTFVIFAASHGILHQGQYAMVTHDFKRGPEDKWFLHTADLMDASKRIRSLRQLFVFDTCHAGGLDSMVTGLYDARMTVMARNMGLHLLTAATVAEEAIDGYRGNGLFTHALLQAIREPETDANGDQSVSAMELGAAAKGKVATISRQIGHRQTPLSVHFGKDQVLYRLQGR